MPILDHSKPLEADNMGVIFQAAKDLIAEAGLKPEEIDFHFDFDNCTGRPKQDLTVPVDPKNVYAHHFGSDQAYVLMELVNKEVYKNHKLATSLAEYDWGQDQKKCVVQGVDDKVADYWAEAQDAGHKVSTLTARSSADDDATFKHMSQIKCTDPKYGDRHIDPTVNGGALNAIGDQANKGQWLYDHYAKMKPEDRPKYVIFADDKEHHVNDVHRAMERLGIKCISFRFTACDKIVEDFKRDTYDYIPQLVEEKHQAILGHTPEMKKLIAARDAVAAQLADTNTILANMGITPHPAPGGNIQIGNKLIDRDPMQKLERGVQKLMGTAPGTFTFPEGTTPLVPRPAAPAVDGDGIAPASLPLIAATGQPSAKPVPGNPAADAIYTRLGTLGNSTFRWLPDGERFRAQKKYLCGLPAWRSTRRTRCVIPFS